ncbi:terpene synthase family protein [Kitasatospora sp. NPDC036755]|uniref:terpene synthase family protein n=1 Tax=Kitasatospora sp. NPDC036755 TaxID=3154600 RepID=UPI0033F143A0
MERVASRVATSATPIRLVFTMSDEAPETTGADQRQRAEAAGPPELPRFFMPFPQVKPNPGQQAAVAPLWEWIDTFGLFTSESSRSPLEQLRIDLISARYHPYAAPESMPLLTQFMAWAWSVDEQFDDGPAGRDAPWCRRSVQGILDAFDGRPCDQPLEAAAADLWPRLSEGRSRRWRANFLSWATGWLWTYYTETLDRATSRYQSPAEYRLHRELSSAEHLFFLLSEAAAGIDLPESVHRLPALRGMRSASAQHQGLFNDVISLNKERPVGYVHNAVALTAHHERVGVGEACERVNALLTECIEQFVTAERQLPAQPAAAGIDDDLAGQGLAMARAYRAHTRGNFDWHFEVTRYAGPGEVRDGRALYVADLLNHRAPGRSSGNR